MFFGKNRGPYDACLFEEFLTSCDATQLKKRRQFMYDFKKITKSSSFLLPENSQYMDFDVFLCRKSIFVVPGIG